MGGEGAYGGVWGCPGGYIWGGGKGDMGWGGGRRGGWGCLRGAVGCVGGMGVFWGGVVGRVCGLIAVPPSPSSHPQSRPRTAPLRPSPHRGFRFGPKRFGSRRTERGGEVGRPPRPLPQPRRSRSLHFRVWVEPLPLPVPALLPVPPSLPLPVPPSLPRGRAVNPARGVGEVGVVVGGGDPGGGLQPPPPRIRPPPARHGTANCRR